MKPQHLSLSILLCLVCGCYVNDGTLCIDWWDSGGDCESGHGTGDEPDPSDLVATPCDEIAAVVGVPMEPLLLSGSASPPWTDDGALMTLSHLLVGYEWEWASQPSFDGGPAILRSPVEDLWVNISPIHEHPLELWGWSMTLTDVEDAEIVTHPGNGDLVTTADRIDLGSTRLWWVDLPYDEIDAMFRAWHFVGASTATVRGSSRTNHDVVELAGPSLGARSYATHGVWGFVPAHGWCRVALNGADSTG